MSLSPSEVRFKRRGTSTDCCDKRRMRRVCHGHQAPWGQLEPETSGWLTYRCGGYAASLAEGLTGRMSLHLPELMIYRAHSERRPNCQRELSSKVVAAETGCPHVRSEGPGGALTASGH